MKPRNYVLSKPEQPVFCASHSVSNHCSRPSVQYPSRTCTKVQVTGTNVQFSSGQQLGTLLPVRETNRRREVRDHDDTKTTFALVIRGHHACVRSSAGVSADRNCR